MDIAAESVQRLRVLAAASSANSVSNSIILLSFL